MKWIECDDKIYLDLRSVKQEYHLGVAFLKPVRETKSGMELMYTHFFVMDGVEFSVYTPYRLEAAKKLLIGHIVLTHDEIEKEEQS